mmetsp:Transcript_48821/g.153282  ORF Transcript_48821/g.153282 Transcript_48821/m.153282 type:complete len:91 (+) Transcript_48821:1403-1675(+)
MKQRGGTVDISDLRGQTPLHYASAYGNYACINVFSRYLSAGFQSAISLSLLNKNKTKSGSCAPCTTSTISALWTTRMTRAVELQSHVYSR